MAVGIGFGNPKRNRYDAEFDSYAFKDVWVSITLDWQISDHVALSPYVAVYEQLHSRLRDAAHTSVEGETHASALVVGGLSLTASF